MKTIADFNFENKKALIRVDFNVPLDENLSVTDTNRIEAAKPTIIKVLEDGGSAVLMSHLGRPKGKISPELSLEHICQAVSEILGVQVKFVNECVGENAENAVAEMGMGEVILLENLRFHSEETSGDIGFAEQISKLGEEIDAIEKVMQTGEKPVLAILGGAKVSSKITIIENILDKVDHLIVSGGMTYTFIKAQGGNVGDSICEDDKMDLAMEILKKAKEKNVEVHIPVDVIAANDFSNEAATQVVDVNKIEDGWQGLDAGPRTLENFKEVILKCKTILWNGPVGVFEMESFAKGTISVGNFIDEATQNGAFSLVGGGDSVAAVKQFGFDDKVSYVSTGGGAMLESLEGKTLPGIAAILK